MKTIITIFFLFIGLITLAQDIEKIAKSKPLDFSGGLRVSANFYDVQGRNANQSPFNWMISGNPTLSIYGFRIPVNILYRGSNLETNYQFPLNRFGATPQWRWIKLHIGQSRMNFSPYTLSGKTFKGFGAVLTPGKFRFSAMRGTFQNLLTQIDTTLISDVLLPTYERKGFGGKIGFGNSRNFIDLMFLNIKDETQTVDFQTDATDAVMTSPEENVVIGTHGKATFFKKISLEINGAASLHSGSTDLEPIPLDSLIDRSAAETISNFIEPNLSTRWGFAGDVNLNFRLKQFSLGAKFRQVDPYFNSLGTFFIRRDLRDYTLNTSFSFLNRKLRFTGRGGVEENNLSGLKAVGSKRIIGSANILISPSPKFTANLNFSNFQRENQAGFLELNDTLRIINVTQMQGLNMTYRIPTETKISTFSININRQTVEDKSEIENIGNDVESLNATFNFSTHWKERGFKLSPNVFYNQFNISDLVQKRYGLGLKVSQSLFDKKLSLNLSGNYRISQQANAEKRSAFNTRFGLRAKLGEHQSVNLSAGFARRISSKNELFRETRGSVAYQFRF